MPKSKEFIDDDSYSGSCSGSEDEDYEPKKKKGKKAVPKKEEKQKVADNKPASVGEVSFQLSKNRWLSVSDYRNKSYVNIREYYEADGEMKPGRKGIALSVDQWKSLKSHIKEIDEALDI